VMLAVVQPVHDLGRQGFMHLRGLPETSKLSEVSTGAVPRRRLLLFISSVEGVNKRMRP